MAAEPPTSSPAPASYPILPQYPELIFAAIEAIDSKNGANKSTISKQIEATYGSLPAAHSTLLSHHLNKMKASGQLIVVKNNYVKPDPNAPPRRGRGRPPKPKEPLPEGTVASPPKPRGRPPKSHDLSSVSSPTAASPPKPRGRPPKSQDPSSVSSPTAASPPKPRGRPPKSHDPTSVSSPKAASPPVSGRKRGRPPKLEKETAAAPPANGEKRGRGRPPKAKTPVAAPVRA